MTFAIESDLIKPTITTFTIPSTVYSLTTPITALIASDNKTVINYLLTESEIVPSILSLAWTTNKPTSYTFTSEGIKNLYAWVKDNSGNISNSLMSQVTVTLPPRSGGGGAYVPKTINNNSITSTNTADTITVSTSITDSANINTSNINIKESADAVLKAKEFVAIEKTLITEVNKTLSEALAGRLLLQVENKGEAWYVNPKDKLKYYLGTPNMAFSVMRTQGIGITNSNLEKIKIANYNLDNGVDSDGDGLSDAFEDAISSNKNSQDSDLDGYNDKIEVLNDYSAKGVHKLAISDLFTRNQGGKIFIQVEGHGEAWYVNPLTNTRYYLGRPEDAYALMRHLSLGITNDNLRKIGVGEIE